MQRRAKGAWVVFAHQAMMQPQGRAAEILQSAHAMTDVTGFGLAGHLAGMMRAADCSATLEIARIPVLDGALDLAADGIRSTIYRANRDSVPELTAGVSPREVLLFDPQTAGGLLAAVEASEADDLVDQLRTAGYDAARIGSVDKGPVSLTLE
jgi:selenide,water dikinase